MKSKVTANKINPTPKKNEPFFHSFDLSKTKRMIPIKPINIALLMKLDALLERD